MQLAFSTAACPDVPLSDLLHAAREWGFAGLEIASHEGAMDRAGAELLAIPPATLRERLAAGALRIVAINSDLSLFHPDSHVLQGRAARVSELIALAERIGCGAVVVRGDRAPSGWSKAGVLPRAMEAIRRLGRDAAKHRVQLLLENTGDLAESQDIWYLRDASGSAAVRVCLNPAEGLRAGEPPTIAVKRFASTLSLVHVSDVAKSDENGPICPAPLGRGDVGIAKLIDLLKGVNYHGFLSLQWPGGAAEALGSAEEYLKSSAAMLRAEIEKPVVPLTAYKGDKNAPKFVKPGPRSAAPARPA